MEAVLIEKGYYTVIITPANNDGKKRAKALAFIRLSCTDGPLLQIRHIADPLTA
jgi:hypothetical protein